MVGGGPVPSTAGVRPPLTSQSSPLKGILCGAVPAARVPRAQGGRPWLAKRAQPASSLTSVMSSRRLEPVTTARRASSGLQAAARTPPSKQPTSTSAATVPGPSPRRCTMDRSPDRVPNRMPCLSGAQAQAVTSRPGKRTPSSAWQAGNRVACLPVPDQLLQVLGNHATLLECALAWNQRGSFTRHPGNTDGGDAASPPAQALHPTHSFQACRAARLGKGAHLRAIGRMH